MSPAMASILGLWSAYWAAMFAQIAHLRSLDDGVGAITCGRVARSLLIVGVAFFLVAKGG
ncbi:hypothetical protein MKK70_26050 [Methylobacterium sp. E-041]|uniref:hypothetical protein n=1 Tax=unclassified Methylobacterium TaxID=2615210 RepID=UPI001FB8C476|nr:hypothetical protein [Methylobacterium sp. E-041]MCJ2108774.1 hypothetical protein [Methylobacterium sp. E-041]